MIASLLAFSGGAYAQVGSLVDARIHVTPGGDAVAMRRLLWRINKALPGIWSDQNVALARACEASDLDFSACVRSAFGCDLIALMSLSPSGLRRAYRARKSDDLKSLSLMILDGYVLASAEYSLGQVLRTLDRT
ncbi:MAG: hypothetical protein ACREQZ_04760 [Woeseiaceae bacterium]